MPIFRLQVAWQMDSAFARDAMVITPHFNDEGVGDNPQGLCDDLADALNLWDATGTQVTVKSYDAQGTPPVQPGGIAVRNPGVFNDSSLPREVALCLSYYAGVNAPRRRGRLYIPMPVIAPAMGKRPATPVMDQVGLLAGIFADLGGVDVDWVVWSRRDQVARPVTNWWVDDEWDTVRSRGLRADTRVVGTTSEV